MLASSTLAFLSRLRKNNNRDWFNNHKDEYESARQQWLLLTGALIAGIGKYDKKISGLEPKECVFRIYRDVRFSKDKTPYQTHLSAYISKDGKKSPAAGYYIHIKPGGESFLAGGMHMPPPPILAKVRQEVDYGADEFKKILVDKKFKKTFGGLWESKISRPPKGYSKDHPEIELLKYNSYIVTHELTDAQVLKKDFVKKAGEIFLLMKPFVDFLNRAMEE